MNCNHEPRQRAGFGKAIKECSACGMGGVQIWCEDVPVIWWDNEKTDSIIVDKLRAARDRWAALNG